MTGDLSAALKAALAERYDVQRQVGAGGMADVFLADDRRLGRRVAIKVLRETLSAAVGAERFVLEIETAARLQHPHILGVYDSGEAAGQLYYVMPYVDGESLRARLDREGALPWSRAIGVLREVGDAVAYAHAHNVIHRDIKPENILFLAEHALVADFGIARVTDAADHVRITQAGEGLGTPAYMSPEQAFGEDDVDARADVYSLACVLYEMLAGAPPFTGPTAYAILLLKSRGTAPVLEPPPGMTVPAHVAPVLARSLAPSPDDRFGSVRDFLTALLEPADEAAGAHDTAPAAHSAASTGSIAVLPFDNLSGVSDDDVVSDGIADELIHALSRVSGLSIVARTSCFAFKGRREDVKVVGKQLGASSVLEGTVRRNADRVRITAHLVDAASGYERWSERYDREVTDVLEVQDEIAAAIVEAVKGKLQPRDRRLLSASTTNDQAHRLYLEGRYRWNQRTETALDQSVACLSGAVAVDPTFADAFAALAIAHTTKGIYGAVAPAAAFPAARDAAARALELRPGASDALAARACGRALYEWAWRAAEHEFQLAGAARNATPTTIQWYAMNLLVPQGRFDEAHTALRDAERLDPLSPIVAASIGLAALYQRDFDTARRRLQLVVERNAGFGVAHLFLGQAESASGAHAEAVASLRQAEALLGESPEVAAALGVALARSDAGEEAERILARLLQLGARRYVSPVLVAQLQAALGRPDDALASLAHAASLRSADLVWMCVRPIFDSLHSRPQFASLAREIGLSLPA